MTSRGFTQVPNSVLRGEYWTARGRLSSSARLLYALVSDFSTMRDGVCVASQQTLAHRLGVSDRQVRTLLRELEAAGLISVRRDGRRLTNAITPLVVPERKPTSAHPRKSTSAEQHVQHSNTERLHDDSVTGDNNAPEMRA